MKVFLSFAILFGSLAASANLIMSPCGFSDYEKLRAALTQYEIRKGGQFTRPLLGVLSQEMGPVCNTIVDTIARPGIPGQRVKRFEVMTAMTRYEVAIFTGVEQPQPYVFIRRTTRK